MRNKGRILKLCTYLLIMVLGTLSILAACAEPAPTPAPPTPAPPTPAPPTPAPPTPAPPTPTPPTPAPGPPTPEKITIAMAGEPTSMDPASTKFIPGTFPTLRNMYEPLIATTKEGKPDPQNGVASFEILEGGKIFEFTLRQGVKFHSGDPLTTQDVEFTHNRQLEKNPTYPSQVRNLDRVEIIDDYKMRFIFKSPEVLFLYETGPQFYIVSKSYYDKVGEEEFVINPSGTGPYKFVEWKTGQYLDIERNEDYWGEKPPIKQAHLIFANEPTTRVSMFQAGEVDMIADTPWELVSELEESGAKTLRLSLLPNMAVGFQKLNPNVPWHDKRVRQAIAYAIDREAIVKDLYYGIPEMYAWLAPGELGYDPELKPYSYNPERAKELLTEAGYPDGFEMPLNHATGGAITGVKDVAEAVTLYLRAINIECNIMVAEGPENQAKIRAATGNPEAVFVNLATPQIANGADPVIGLNRQFYTPGPQALFGGNPELDAIIEKAVITIDDTERGELIKQAFRIMHEDVPIVPILTNVSVYTMKPNITYTPPKGTMRMVLVEHMRIQG